MRLIKLFLSLMLLAQIATAHEGHDTPGVLPLAPNGGKLGEAIHKGEHKHEGEEKELFFEVVYKKKELRLYPFVLEEKKKDRFLPVSPTKDLSNLSIKIEFPRSKKEETLKPTIKDNVIVASFDSKRAYRFFVHISAIHDKEQKLAKIQIEKK